MALDNSNMPNMPDTTDALDNRLAAALQWDWGTAYEMLVSLYAIFRPKQYSLPAPWAAGVRKKLPAHAQRDLKGFFSPSYAYIAYMPLHLVWEMKGPKNATGFIEFLEAIPDAEFMHRVRIRTLPNSRLEEVTSKALAGSKLTESDIEAYRRGVEQTQIAIAPTAAEVRRLFSEVADPSDTKRRYVAALKEYEAAFFAQEELRAGPALAALERKARTLAENLSIPDLLERITN
ncbi:MAG: hypothetical protein M3014_12725, partial [Chloroflexota bacterium]|nr:hypothetical protein [Chloroflexota bacterium]